MNYILLLFLFGSLNPVTILNTVTCISPVLFGTHIQEHMNQDFPLHLSKLTINVW